MRMNGTSLISHLLQKLQEGAVKFAFRKQDGTIREALGTLNTELFHYEFKTNGKVSNPDIIKYWDLEKESWRCFHVEDLVFVS